MSFIINPRLILLISVRSFDDGGMLKILGTWVSIDLFWTSTSKN
jgi:hypothetical protein